MQDRAKQLRQLRLVVNAGAQVASMRGHKEEHDVLQRVLALLEKTIEKGALPEEEKASVQLAYQLTCQQNLDIAVFKRALARIGAPPRYVVTDDGFLVPAASQFREGVAVASAPECPESPSGKHWMAPIMQGTFRTDFEGCVHCGARRKL